MFFFSSRRFAVRRYCGCSRRRTFVASPNRHKLGSWLLSRFVICVAACAHYLENITKPIWGFQGNFLPQNTHDDCSLQHRQHEAPRAAGVGCASELHCKELYHTRAAWLCLCTAARSSSYTWGPAKDRKKSVKICIQAKAEIANNGHANLHKHNTQSVNCSSSRRIAFRIRLALGFGPTPPYRFTVQMYNELILRVI